MSAIPITPEIAEVEWKLPYKGTVGMIAMIIAESAIFLIFVVAYIYYIGKSLSGPTPKRCWRFHISPRWPCFRAALPRMLRCRRCGRARWGVRCLAGATIALALIFLFYTAKEWYELIYHFGLTIKTNLFGTTFYSLVGLHATHVVVGLIMLTIALIAALRKAMNEHHAEKLEVLSLYWHFVDAVWVVVFTVVYVLGR